MFAWTSHGTELARFSRHRITRAAIAVMLFVPLLYGAMYVWAFWDPTTRMDELPVALVNADVPATTDDGTVINAGQEVVDELVDRAPLQWHQVSAAQAEAGVAAGSYYFAVTIPPTFSTSVASLAGDDPVPASINVTYDDSNSFLASTLGRSAMVQINDAIRAKVGDQAVDTLLVGLGEARDGFAKASDGAFKLSDGLSTASQGVDRLNVGAQDLQDGAAQLAAGADKLAAGTGRANRQVAPLASGVTKLSSGGDQLAAALDTLAARTPVLVAGLGQLSDGLTAASTGASSLADGGSQLVTALTQARDGVALLASGADGLTALTDGLNQLADPQNGAPALAVGAARLQAGYTDLADGATGVAAGATEFADGAGNFATGAQRWLTGARAATAVDGPLSKGTADLAAGSDRLAKATGSGSDLAGVAAAVADGTKRSGQQFADLDDALAAAQRALRDGDPDAAATILDQARQSVGQAQSQAGQLARAAAGVTAGIADLHDGAADLAAGAEKLQDGWQQAGAAVAPGGQLADGADGLAQAQSRLASGAGQLSSGAQVFGSPQTRGRLDALAGAADRLAEALTTMNAAAANPTTGVPALQAGARQLLAGFDNPDPSKGLVAAGAALRDGATALDGGLATLNDGATALAQGAGGLATGVDRLAAASHQLAGGLDTLKDGTPQLLAGVRQLDDGARKLAAGTSTLADGTAELAGKTPELGDGLHRLADGADELGSALAEGTQQLPDDSPGLRAQRGEAISTPVELTDSHLYQAESWGEGFAPFFIPLALWVGALITWLLLRPLQSRALMTSVNGFRMAWGALNPALLLALGQVTIMLAVMHFAIGLDAANWPATVGFALLAAAAFFALQQFFQVAFGSAVGKVIAIVLLMVQLASSSGTYPIQTTPEFLQAISGWMPMTYVVAGLRESITGGLDARFWSSVVVLAGIFVVSLLGSAIASSRKRMWTMSRLHPALSI